ncbi:MAG: hypothetical protein VYA51_12680 [Planctomycetota bacterium]|nr:hypothetical protein [Planctomycetota bacterium]
MNTSGAAAYISLWSGTGTSRTAAERAGGPWLVPDGHAAPVLFEHPANGGCVVAAHTAADATGAPSSSLDFVPFWDIG